MIDCVRCLVTYEVRTKFFVYLNSEVFNMRLLDLDYYASLGIIVVDAEVYKMDIEIKRGRR